MRMSGDEELGTNCIIQFQQVKAGFNLESKAGRKGFILILKKSKLTRSLAFANVLEVVGMPAFKKTAIVGFYGMTLFLPMNSRFQKVDLEKEKIEKLGSKMRRKASKAKNLHK